MDKELMLNSDKKLEAGIRVLFVSALYYPDHAGGAEVSTQIIAESLSDTYGFDVTVLCHSSYGEEREENVNGVHVIRHCFPYSDRVFLSLGFASAPSGSLVRRVMNRMSEFWVSRKVKSFYEKLFQDYDVIVFSGNTWNMNHLSAWEAGKELCKPLVHILRDPYFLYFQSDHRVLSLFKYWYRARMLHGIDEGIIVIGPTQRILDAHFANYGKAPKTQYVISNPLDDSKCHVADYCEKENAIVYVGSISAKKGVPTLIKAFGDIESEDLELWVIGNEHDYSPVGKRVTKFGHLSVEETYSRVGRAKVLVLPSEYEEAFGRVLVEAAFNGTVCIGSDAGGIPEVLGFNERYIFKAGDALELKKKLETVLYADELEYSSMLDEQLAIVEHCQKDVVAKKWHHLIQSLAYGVGSKNKG